MDPYQQFLTQQTRRHFFGNLGTGVGTAALAMLLNNCRIANSAESSRIRGQSVVPHFPAKAKRVIYLFQSGGPSHIELLDYKSRLQEMHGGELPDSIRRGQRLTGMTSGQSSFPIIAPKFGFTRWGENGTYLSDLLPYTGMVLDDLCLIRSMHTEAINHDPAITFIQSGSQQPGRPSFGAWMAYGLGSENADLPAFVVMISHGSGADSNQGLLDRLWGSGFLPSSYQGVKFRAGSDPVLYLSDPPGIDRTHRRKMLDGLAKLNEQEHQKSGDPEIISRIAQYEMAFRMQVAVPEIAKMDDESAATFELYGSNSRKPGTFAANCLLARRLVERGVRFVQLYHRGWDQHKALPENMPKQCKDVDQPQAALITDLKQRGLLEDTLVIWAGEFGRTVYAQGPLQDNYGRDHHGRCFSIWLSGGGIRPGIVHGETDDFAYNITRDPVHIHDLNATLLHCLGLDHEHLAFRFQGRDFRLTDVHGTVVRSILT